ncbi:uncharacterized protein PG998_010203 [Apiospora kogelbergensis]|uniref:uncharacterized protein n=1 Tax=Apiospora kogelbergensis TaxID=1337665 RepID=UPI00312EC69D
MLSISSPQPGGGQTGFFQALRSTGWRRTGAFNALAAFASGFVLLCCLIISASRPESSLQSDTVLFYGSCKNSRYLNIILHLTLNIVSSAVLGSSNYFMQILNAPSREEINLAHRKLSSLEIGIPSLKNLPFLSRFKQCLWALLIITSLPIHLLFNSAIYETAYEGSAWNLTIATEQFLHGASFFLPGASLAPGGRPSPVYNTTVMDSTYSEWDKYWYSSYGKFTEISEYWNESSSIHRAFSEMTGSLRGEGRDPWDHLSSKECRREYCSCSSRQNYGDVIVIVDAGPNRDGWIRAEVYADPQDDLPNLTKTNLDQHIPRDDLNSLWYYTQCTHHKRPSDTLEDVSCEEPSHGDNAVCSGALGYYWDRMQHNPRGIWQADALREYDQNMMKSSEEAWSIMFKNRTGPFSTIEQKLGYNDSFSTLSVAYCLAHRGPTEKCKVNVANNILLVVVICVFCKVSICTLVVVLLPAESLVTPGDAINSFLCQPDVTTSGVSGDVGDFHRLEYALPHPLAEISDEYAFVSHVPRARAWQQKRRRICSIMPRSAWWRAYAPVAASLVVLTILTVMAYEGNNHNFGRSFGHDGATLLVKAVFGRTFLGGLILANIGQLILSWCYFAYNSLLTRIHVEKELNSYSTSFKALRVSFPEGKQSVTWRLQLPYKFGIPLLLISILLHWLTSNSIFLLIIEGGFWKSVGGNNMEVSSSNRGLDPESIVAVSYSPLAILITLVVGATLAPVPILVSLYRLPGDMVAGGCNSLVLSAACHAFLPVPTTDEASISEEASGVDEASVADEVYSADEALLNSVRGSQHRLTSTSSSDNDEEEQPPGQGTHRSDADDDGIKKALVTLAQSKLRWGVVPLPQELCYAARETGQEALHLSFATEETYISPPVAGELYM